MLKPSNLQLVYSNFPKHAEDFGSLKAVNLLTPNCDGLTTLMLIEAERFWAATLLQLFATRELHRTWLYTWGEVTLYYAHFFVMNAILRLSGRALTFSQKPPHEGKVFRIKRTSTQTRDYEVKETRRTDHRTQWELYYELIGTQPAITDDATMQQIFTTQLRFRHDYRESREMLNYDLEFGYKERHKIGTVKSVAAVATSMLPFDNPMAVFRDKFSDIEYDIAEIVYTWKYLKTLLSHLAETTDFKNYWYRQITKLREFVQESPQEDGVKAWAVKELQTPI